MTGTIERVPRAVSEEAYRIVQECLTNAARHAGRVPVTLRLAAGADQLTIEAANPLGTGGGGAGGRGLRGIAERVAVLRGRVTAGPEDGRWVVRVALPLRAGR